MLLKSQNKEQSSGAFTRKKWIDVIRKGGKKMIKMTNIMQGNIVFNIKERKLISGEEDIDRFDFGKIANRIQ